MNSIFDPVNKISLKFKVIKQKDASLNVLFELFRVSDKNTLIGNVFDFFLAVDDFDFLFYSYTQKMMPFEGLPFIRGKNGNARGIKFTVSSEIKKPGHMTITLAKGTGQPDANGFTKFETTLDKLLINISFEQCVKMFTSLNREILIATIK